jgi:hypothetical protein
MDFCIVGGAILYFNINILGEYLSSRDYIIAKKLLTLMVIKLAVSFPNNLFTAYMFANERFVFQKSIAIIANIMIPIIKDKVQSNIHIDVLIASRLQ